MELFSDRSFGFLSSAQRAWLLLLLFASAVPAQNLVSNGGFQSNVNNWETLFGIGVLVHDPRDSSGRVDSGSLRLEYTPDGGISSIEADQCLPIAGGRRYRYGANVARLGANPGTGIYDEFVQVGIYSTPDCDANSAVDGSVSTYFVTELREWRSVEGTVSAPSNARSAQIRLLMRHDQAGSLQRAWFDNVFFMEADGTCVPQFSTECVGNGRFEITASYEDAQGVDQFAAPTRLTSDSLVFSFFNPNNLELNLKVLDACNPFGNVWVIGSGSTNVPVRIYVRDTATGKSKTYRDEGGDAFETFFDLKAFDCL